MFSSPYTGQSTLPASVLKNTTYCFTITALFPKEQKRVLEASGVMFLLMGWWVTKHVNFQAPKTIQPIPLTQLSFFLEG